MYIQNGLTLEYSFGYTPQALINSILLLAILFFFFFNANHLNWVTYYSIHEDS